MIPSRSLFFVVLVVVSVFGAKPITFYTDSKNHVLLRLTTRNLEITIDTEERAEILLAANISNDLNNFEIIFGYRETENGTYFTQLMKNKRQKVKVASGPNEGRQTYVIFWEDLSRSIVVGKKDAAIPFLVWTDIYEFDEEGASTVGITPFSFKYAGFRTRPAYIQNETPTRGNWEVTQDRKSTLDDALSAFWLFWCANFSLKSSEVTQSTNNTTTVPGFSKVPVN